MRVSLEDIGYLMLGRSFGAWYWVPNSKTVHPKLRTHWDTEPGSHPFVLTQDYDGGPIVRVRARSLSSRSGAPHEAHPPRHVPTCRIREDGRIVKKAWALTPDALAQEHYSCREPEERLSDLQRILGVR